MPNIITHTLFAQDAFEKVDESLREVIEPRLQLFEIGSNGPDFLFFHGLNVKDFYKSSDLRKAGNAFHAGHVNDFYHQAIVSIQNEKDEEIKKDMMTYVCGHLCHWALDSTTHPYVFYRTGTCKGKSAWYHHRFESLIDAIMLKVKKECTIEDFKFYSICDAPIEYVRAIARVYVPAIRKILGYDVKGHDIYDSLKDWDAMEQIFYDASGKKITGLKAFEKITNTDNLLSGYIVPNVPDDPYDVMNLLHNRWIHPSDDTLISTESFFDLYEKALLLANEVIRLFVLSINNSDYEKDFLQVIGNRNYNLGKNDQKEMYNFDLIY